MVAHDGATQFSLDRLPYGWEPNIDRLKVGYIGSFYQGRGVELIIKVAGHCPHIDFHLVGASEKDLVRLEKQVPENVTLIGFVPPAESHKYMNASDVLLAPYQRKVFVYGNRGDTSDYMSPLKIFEYMASGKAIVASDIPVLHEVLESEKDCLFVSPADVDGWINALYRLQEQGLREKLGDSARTKFLEKYTWEKRAEIVIKDIDAIH